MKILEAQSATLSNFEVYTHLKDIQKKHRTGGRRPGNLDNVIKEVAPCFIMAHKSKTDLFLVDAIPRGSTFASRAKAMPI